MRFMNWLVCLLVIAGAVLAQSDRGTITGTVSDPAGAIVAGASVEAKNLETGGVYQAGTTTTGNYTLSQLPVGTYELSIGVPGFKKYLRTGITVLVAQTLRIDVTLEVGSTNESITVQADAPLLKTESGEVSHNVQTEKLDELPILGIGSVNAGSSQIRNPYAVTNIVPGAYYQPNNTVKINGAPANQQVYRVEGQDATLGYANWTTAEVQPSVDSIQETAIQTSNYSAEYGGGGGNGVFNVTMKSGSNQYHGSGYDYMINEAFNAAQPFTGLLQRNRRNDFGGTLGGPVYIPKVYNGHDRTFFFFNFEQLIGNDIVNNTPVTLPTALYRQGDFSKALGRNLGTDPLQHAIIENTVYDPRSDQMVNGQIVRTPFQGNMIPMSLISPVAMKIQNLVPMPQSGAIVNNYLPVFITDRNTMIPAVKIDELLNSRQKLSFYWSKTGTDSQYSNTTGGADGLPQPISGAIGTFIHSWIVRLNYDHTLSPTLLLHVGVGYQHLSFNQDPPTRDFDPTAQLGLKGPFSPRLFPVMTGLLSASQGGLKNIGPAADSLNWMEKPTAAASITWVKNSHTYKLGGDMRIEGYPTRFYGNTDGNFTFSAAESGQPYLNATTLNGGSVGFPYASFLLGLVDSYNIVPVNSPKFGKQQWALFIQDSWKITRRLTLDYGLRWDYGTYEKEQYGRLATLSPTTANPTAGGHPGAPIFEGSGPGRCNCTFAHNYPYALGPRVGLAYQITPKTVFRGGIGVVYSSTPENNQTTGRASPNNLTLSPAFGFPAMTFAQGVPLSASDIAWPNYSPGVYPRPNQLTPGIPVVVDQNAGRPGRQIQWSAGIQRELAQNLVVEATYLGNRGAWWQAFGLVNYNANSPARLASFGLSLNNPADVALLNLPLNNSQVVAKGFTAPYAGFPLSAPLAQALRPFPQYQDALAPIWAPLGDTWYNALQTSVTKRYSAGFDFTFNFVWQKSLTLGAENDTAGGLTGQVNDIYNRKNAKTLSGYDQPFISKLALDYTTPKWSHNKWLSLALSDWRVSPFMQYASGLPILSPYAQNNLNRVTFQVVNAGIGATGTFANRVPGMPLFLKDPNCHCINRGQDFILNPAAWTDPAAGQFGTAAPYYSDYRYARRPVENIAVGRTFRFTERVTLNVRIEFNNVLNRTQLSNPTSTNARQTLARDGAGNVITGFGAVNNVSLTTGTTFSPPRTGTLVARFQF